MIQGWNASAMNILAVGKKSGEESGGVIAMIVDLSEMKLG